MKQTFYLSLLLSLIAYSCGPNPQTDSPIPTATMQEKQNTSNTVLFLDDVPLAKQENVKRIMVRPEKYSQNPILVQDQPWESQFVQAYGTVLYDEDADRFRMWYMASEGSETVPEYYMCYAESEDGIAWQKPMNGTVTLRDYERHNAVLTGAHGLCVLYDPNDPDPQLRYKGLGGNTIAFSPDGLHWTTQEFTAVEKNDTSSCVVKWNDEYLAFVRTQAFIGSSMRTFIREQYFRTQPIRENAVSRSSDFINWSLKVPVISTYINETNYPWEQPDGMAVTPYGDLLIGLVWFIDLNQVKGNFSDGTLYTRMAVSRNGTDWTWVDDTKFLMGTEGEWDSGHAFPSTSLVKHDGRVWLYYTGMPERHGKGIFDESGIGLAWWDENRFGGLTPTVKNIPGTVELMPFAYSGETILINTDGTVQLELLDENGNVIPGFERENCRVTLRDELQSKVEWPSADILERQTVTIRCTITDGTLFALSLEEEEKPVNISWIEPLNRIIATPEKTLDESWEEGLLYYRKGQFGLAKQEFTKVLDTSPNHADAWSYLGLCHARLGDPREGIQDVNHALDIEPKAEYYYRRGLIWCSLQNYEIALNDFSSAIQLDANRSEYYVERGLTQSKLLHNKDAIEDFNRGSQLNPDDPYVFADRTICYINLQDYEKALNDANRSIEDTPDFNMAYYLRGLIYGAMQQYDKAIADLNHAMELGLDGPRLFFYRGKFQILSKNSQKGIDDLNHYRTLEPLDAESYYLLGGAYGQLDQWEKAIQNYSQFLEMQPNNVNAIFNRGVNYMKILDFDNAIHDFQSILTAVPTYAHYYLGCTYCLRYMNEPKSDTAESDLDNAFKFLNQSITLGLKEPGLFIDNPMLLGIYDDPRFEKLSKRITQ